MRIYLLAASIALSSCAVPGDRASTPESHQKQFLLCGQYFYEFGDVVKFEPGPISTDNTVLIVRDSRSWTFISHLGVGGTVRIVVTRVDACGDSPKTNSAACIQAGGSAYVFVRPMHATERCDDAQTFHER
jgi:hypothetical protein